jgi:hypothetical protein
VTRNQQAVSMKKRRCAVTEKLLWLVTALLLACIHLAEAQQAKKVPRIGILSAPFLCQKKTGLFRFFACRECFLKSLMRMIYGKLSKSPSPSVTCHRALGCSVATDCLLPSNSDMAALPYFTTTGDDTMRILFKVVVATVTFLVFFYSTTVAMSVMYALDSSMLSF